MNVGSEAGAVKRQTAPECISNKGEEEEEERTHRDKCLMMVEKTPKEI